MSPGSMSRRAVLRGFGTAIMLPFFESLVPRAVRAASTPPKRMLTFYCPNGMNMQVFTPAKTGTLSLPTPPTTLNVANTQMVPGFSLSYLQPLQDSVLVLNNLHQVSAEPSSNDNQGGDHARGTAGFATSCHVNHANPYTVGTSADQMVAPTWSAGCPYPSIQLGLNMHAGPDSNLPEVMSEATSWANSTTPLPCIDSPTAAFLSYFSDNAGFSNVAAAQRLALRKSILDDVLSQTSALQSRLSQAETTRLDEFLTGLRQIEARILGGASGSSAAACRPAAPGAATSLQDTYTQMMDLTVLAFQCGLTNVVSFMSGPSQTTNFYNWLGVTDAHHALSHFGGDANYNGADPTKLQQFTTINTYEVAMFARILTALKNTPEGSGSMLDNTVAVLSSDISNGQNHTHTSMPVIVAGKLGGFVHTGQSLDCAGADMASLWLTILKQGAGLSITSFGGGNQTALLTQGGFSLA